MEDVNGLRPEGRKARDSTNLGDSALDKPKGDKPSSLNLADIMSSRSTSDKQNFRKESGSQSDKGTPSTLAILFGLGLIRQFEDTRKEQTYRWSSSFSNFPDLPTALGRKYLQAKKVDVKREEDSEEHSKNDKIAALNKIKKEEQSAVSGKDKDAQELEQEAPERDDILEEEIAHELEVDKIYNEKDYLEEIERATNLSLGVEDYQKQGNQMFKDMEKIHPPDMLAASATIPGDPLSKQRLRECIKNMSKGKILVVGDLLIDELLEGRPERISREAPVLILEHVETELILGGAANTAHNVAALKGTCHAIGVCGKDEYANKLVRLLEKHGITHSLVSDPSRPTTVKTRILSKSHSFKQQLLRLDRISHATIDSAIENSLADKISRIAGDYQAMILSDYRGGIISSGLIAACRKVAKENKLMLIVDAQDDFERFQNVTLLTPNQPDAEKAVGFTFNSLEKLNAGGKALLALTGAQALLLTRGPDGMVLFKKEGPPYYLPVFNHSAVFDVTGAGGHCSGDNDTSLVTGSSLEEATALGNLAAGIVVRKPGTAVTNQEEMINTLEQMTLETD